jgi:MoaA/NifB/PqqE/SkfB family radical SAM enzyme
VEQALRLTDVLISMRPYAVYISGGEPLLMKGLQRIAERCVAVKVPIGAYVSGFGVDEEAASWMCRLLSEIHVSVDGADAATHDFIRGMPGSFDQAMNALSLFDNLAARKLEAGGTPLEFGFDCSVVQSNFHQLEQLCADVVRRFPRLRYVFLSAAIPSGLASREGYAEHELLADEQWAALRDKRLAASLQALAPANVKIHLLDSRGPPRQPSQIATDRCHQNVMHIEPDGEVRAMSQFEGTVGNLLEEPPEVLWARARERQRDAFVARELSGVRTMKEWAAATRDIDERFGSSAVLARISKRQEHTAEALSARP